MGRKGEGKGKDREKPGEGGVVEERGNGAEPEPGSQPGPPCFFKKKKNYFLKCSNLCWRVP